MPEFEAAGPDYRAATLSAESMAALAEERRAEAGGGPLSARPRCG